MPARPVRIAVLNDYEIVVAGVAAALEPYADLVEVVELDSGVRVVSDVDLVLYDSFGGPEGDRVGATPLGEESRAKVVVFSWSTRPELVRSALARGAAGYLAKSLSGRELAEALVRIHGGEQVTPASGTAAEPGDATSWPGREHGLTAREAEVVALITQGLSNQEIADLSYLSINSVKTYIRTAYRKIGVHRRSQAVAWGIAHGFLPDRTRRLES